MRKLALTLVVAGYILAMILSGCVMPGLSSPTPLVTSLVLPETPLPTVSSSSLEQPVPTITSAPSTLIPTVPLPTEIVVQALPLVTSPSLLYIDMKDAQLGWGWTDQYVLHTLDGGQTWENVTPEGGFYSGSSLSGAFLDATHGWVLLPASDYLSGTLYRTQDTGHTWQAAAVPFAGASFDFVNVTIGWAMVGTGAAAGSSAVDIYQTIDSGANWTRLYSLDPTQGDSAAGLPFAGSKNGIGFASTTRGWVGGAMPMDGYVWLFVTQDGGLTWQHQDLVLPAGFEQAMTSVDAPIFFNSLEGVLPVQLYLGELVSTVFYRTTDGGLTWQATRPVTLIGPHSISSMNDYWVWDGKTLVASYDGGQNWQSIPADLALEDSISQLDFVAPAQGWVTGMNADGVSTLYQTVDGGFNWDMPGGEPAAEVVPSPTATPVASITPAPTVTTKPASASAPAKRSGISFTAGYVKDPPVIDGILDEWTETRYDIGSVTYGKGEWTGNADLSGKAMFAWDETYLYLAARVYDDIHAQNAIGEDIFLGDGIEFLLDRNVPADYYTQNLSSDDYQLGISAGAPADMSNSDSKAVLPEDYLWYPKASEGPRDEVEIGVFYTDDGYKIEAAIPWTMLGITPARGQHYGFAFSVSDNDNPSKNIQQTLMTTVPTRVLTDPTSWGDLTLGG
jgi:photosystem II stability/assembly factor-like uncharacterized protein